MRQKDSSKSNKAARIVEMTLLGAAFLGVLASCLFLWLRPKGVATTATVLFKGEVIHRLFLQEEKELAIATDIGEVHIHIHDGGVAIESSPCMSQYCVHQGFKSKAGESIVCAPAGLSILLQGEEVWEVGI